MNIIYMGTPEFAVYPLKKLIESKHDIKCVVSQPDSMRDRGKKLKPTPVKEVALEHGIDILQPEKIKGNTEFVQKLASYEPDVIVVAAYGKILPKEILDIPKYACINIHGSLLPKWRGAAPIQRSIMNGDEVVGVSIMVMEEGLDTGDVITTVMTSNEIEKINSEELFKELSYMGGLVIVETLEKFVDNKLNRIKQDESKATYAPMISKEEGLLDFNESAKKIECKIRGLYTWPGTYTYMNGEILKVWEADVMSEDINGQVGEIVKVDKDGIYVVCGHGTLVLKTIQVPNKKRMSVSEYIKGNEVSVGTILGKGK